MTQILKISVWVCIHFMFIASANSAELSYSLSSPLVGGNNSAPYQIELARDVQKKQIAAKSIADEKQAIYDAKAEISNSPSARLSNALQSQLFTQISMKVSEKILNSSTAGSFAFGDLFVGYSRVDAGTVRVTINSPSGTSTLDLPY